MDALKYETFQDMFLMMAESSIHHLQKSRRLEVTCSTGLDSLLSEHTSSTSTICMHTWMSTLSHTRAVITLPSWHSIQELEEEDRGLLICSFGTWNRMEGTSLAVIHWRVAYICTHTRTHKLPQNTVEKVLKQTLVINLSHAFGHWSVVCSTFPRLLFLFFR